MIKLVVSRLGATMGADIRRNAFQLLRPTSAIKPGGSGRERNTIDDAVNLFDRFTMLDAVQTDL